MEKVIIGFAVNRSNMAQCVKAFRRLEEYMDANTSDSLKNRLETLYLFDMEKRTFRQCSALEADVQNEVESAGKRYISMNSCDPDFFVDYVCAMVRLADIAEVEAPKLNPSGTESVKNDRKDHKVRWDLIPMEPINEIAKVYTAGADKYGPDRWQNLEDGFNRYRGAACRHLFEYMQGHRYDEETKCMHLAQCAWNVIAMIYLDMHGRGLFPFSTLKPASLDGGELDKYEGDSPVEKLMNMLKLKGGGE